MTIFAFIFAPRNPGPDAGILRKITAPGEQFLSVGQFLRCRLQEALNLSAPCAIVVAVNT
jgi:hypothetical protein